MTDEPIILHSHEADEKEPSKRGMDEDNPKQHGSEVHGTEGETSVMLDEGLTGS